MERRIAAGEGKVIRERLEFADAASRTLVYTIPHNVPFPVKDYRATMRVRAKGTGSELDWSVTFEPVGASEADARKAIEGMYGVMIGWIEGRVKASGGGSLGRGVGGRGAGWSTQLGPRRSRDFCSAGAEERAYQSTSARRTRGSRSNGQSNVARRTG